jgi:hypothetical protein
MFPNIFVRTVTNNFITKHLTCTNVVPVRQYDMLKFIEHLDPLKSCSIYLPQPNGFVRSRNWRKMVFHPPARSSFSSCPSDSIKYLSAPVLSESID